MQFSTLCSNFKLENTIKPLGRNFFKRWSLNTKLFLCTYVRESLSVCVYVCVCAQHKSVGPAKSLRERRLKSSWETFMSSERIFVLVFHVLLWILRRRLRELISNFITHTQMHVCKVCVCCNLHKLGQKNSAKFNEQAMSPAAAL